ncbi:MAG TPA: hypothetical protein VGO85_19875 [Caldimonas sp.]|jgi:hypothetical protein|nr:hypothetical protein [Caldimonas sp.]
MDDTRRLALPEAAVFRTSLRRPTPERPAPKELGWLDKLLSSRKTRIEDASRQAIGRYDQELANWQRQQEDFNKAVARRKLLVERLIYESTDAMETFRGESA